jgi:hypothetical protein
MRQGPFPEVWPFQVSRFLTSTITFQTFEHKLCFSYTFTNWDLTSVWLYYKLNKFPFCQATIAYLI